MTPIAARRLAAVLAIIAGAWALVVILAWLTLLLKGNL